MEVQAKFRTLWHELDRGVSRTEPDHVTTAKHFQHVAGDRQRRESDRRRELLARRHLTRPLWCWQRFD